MKFVRYAAVAAVSLLPFLSESAQITESLAAHQKVLYALYDEAESQLASYWKRFNELGSELVKIKDYWRGVLTEEDRRRITEAENYVSNNPAGRCIPLLRDMYLTGREIQMETGEHGGDQKDRLITAYSFAEKSGIKGIECLSFEERHVKELKKHLEKIKSRL